MTYFTQIKYLISYWDHRFANILASIRTPSMVDFFSAVTFLGQWEIVVVLALVVSGVFWLKHRRGYIFPLWLALAGSEGVVMVLKLLVHRARPAVALLAEHDFSFPSGHAAISMAFYGFVVYAYFRVAKTSSQKVIQVLLGSLIIVLVGVSRLYLGVHFMSDVVAGYFVGTFWLLVGMVISERLNKNDLS